MPDQKPRHRSPRRTPDPVAAEQTPAAVTHSARPESATAGRCNLLGCDGTPEWRGLCAAHRQTHRGLADPKEAT